MKNNDDLRPIFWSIILVLALVMCAEGVIEFIKALLR